MDIDWRELAEVVPVLVALVVFGAPALYLYIVRESRIRLRELELRHDSKVAELTRERDVLDARLQMIEPQLDFFRQLAGGSGGQRLRIDPLSTQVPADAEQEPLDDDAIKSTMKRG